MLYKLDRSVLYIQTFLIGNHYKIKLNGINEKTDSYISIIRYTISLYISISFI